MGPAAAVCAGAAAASRRRQVRAHATPVGAGVDRKTSHQQPPLCLRRSLTEPSHELLFLEDWSSWRRWDDARAAGAARVAAPAGGTADDDGYVPLQSIIGRVVGEGPNVMTDFDLKKRPFIGTTTMDAVCSHLAAAAAAVSEGDLVLDPFCGTGRCVHAGCIFLNVVLSAYMRSPTSMSLCLRCRGSLLIAVAALGGRVVGTDIDGDCLCPPALALASTEGGNAQHQTAVPVSKNRAFQRFGAFNYSQANKTTADNFVFYGLQDRVVSLFGADAGRWASDDAMMEGFGLFDAIVTDPPYSRRERARALPGGPPAPSDGRVPPGPAGAGAALAASYSDQTGYMGDPLGASETLLRLAARRLRRGGRLVFWLPTAADVSEDDVRGLLGELARRAGPAAQRLRYQRATAEELNGSLWRWLCVLIHDP